MDKVIRPALLILVAVSQILKPSLTSPGHAARLPHPSPITCNATGCTLDNYQRMWIDRLPCRAAMALYPSSETDLFQAVALASKTRSKIKVVSKGSHSIPKLACPGSDHGILVSTQYYNSLIHVNLSSNTVTAHAGVMVGDLVHAIAKHGLSLPHSPLWKGVSVAGMISTGAHGSGMWGKGGAVHEYVVEMRIIIPANEEEGYAKVVTLVEGDADLNAARLSLGVLGAISTVTFQLEPEFKRSIKLEIKGDENIEQDILELASAHEYAALNWYPTSGKLLLRVDDRVSVQTHGDGAYKPPIFHGMEVGEVESMSSIWKASEEAHNIEELRELEAQMPNFRHGSGDGLFNFESTFVRYPVVGFNHKIQTAGGCEVEETSPIITPTGLDFDPTHEHHTQRWHRGGAS